MNCLTQMIEQISMRLEIYIQCVWRYIQVIYLGTWYEVIHQVSKALTQQLERTNGTMALT